MSVAVVVGIVVVAVPIAVVVCSGQWWRWGEEGLAGWLNAKRREWEILYWRPVVM